MDILDTLPESGLRESVGIHTAIALQEAHRPVGGRLMHFWRNWRKISSDEWIHNTITGFKLDLLSPPYQQYRAVTHLDSHKAPIMSEQVRALSSKEAITPVPDTQEGFVSPVFLVPKPDGSWRTVINLKSLNRFVAAPHFKMESIKTVKGLIQEGDWMVKLDLKDAYLAIPIHAQHQKFLQFRWDSQTWQFKTLPFGLNSAPHTFTKLMKPVVAVIRRLAVRLILYLDDMLIAARTTEEVRRHLATALELLVALGFIINIKKSIFEPTQNLEFLGFQLNSLLMTISLPKDKLHAIRKAARRLQERKKCSVRDLAHLLGMMVAAHPAILPAPLHYRNLELGKTRALHQGGSYEQTLQLNARMNEELTWWIVSSVHHNGRPLQISTWDLTIESDSSLTGWGAVCKGRTTGGLWMIHERVHHINYLELKAAFLALKSYVRDATKISILLRLDNITAISFINRMGGTHSITLSELATEIWNWCIERQIMIHAEHLPGVENIQADWQSRHLTDSSDWKLHLQAFQAIEDKLGPFSIDLFASRTNHQLPTYCSWRPDPAAMAIDGLSITWRRHHPYMFPPFSLIPRCLEKLEMEKVQAVLIAPVWPNQVWYPRLLESLIGQPLILPPVQDILTDPDEHCHPLVMEGHLPLAAWPISGDHARHRDFLTELSASSGAPGDNLLRQHIHQLGDCGPAGVLNGTSIPFQPL